MLFPPNRRRQPGRRTERGFIHAVVEMKQRNPNWGAPRVAQQLACALAFHIPIDKNVVRRISRPSLPTGLRWSLLADIPGLQERQSVERESVPARDFARTLDRCGIRSALGENPN